MAKQTGKGLYGVGYNSGGKHTVKGPHQGKARAYVVWRSILMRCYQRQHHTTHQYGDTYNGVIVCAEWHDYQNFAEWYYNNFVEGWEIDKELIYPNTNIYSPEHCRFVPIEINALFKKKVRWKILPTGVCKVGERYLIPQRLARTCNRPVAYTDEESAHRAYLQCKAISCRELLNKYVEYLDADVCTRLLQIADLLENGTPFSEIIFTQAP